MSSPRPHVDAVLFDLGGTLVDERDFDGWAAVARRVYLDLDPDLLRHAFFEVEREHDVSPIGPPRAPGTDAEFWRRILARASEREVDLPTASRFLEAKASVAGRPPLLYSDTRRCLDALKADHRRLGVVSNSQSEASVRTILDRTGILGYFERVVSSGTEGVAKPEPAIFRRAVDRMKLAPQRALFVGNLEHTDALAAERAGLRAVWLNREGTGFTEGTPEITSLLEVPLVLAEIERADGASKAAPPSHA